MDLPDFIPGLDLAEAFYWEAVRPIIVNHFPDLPHSAALIGFGSDVIGQDTPMSRDHMWGPRMQVFIPSSQFDTVRPLLHEALSQELPTLFRGYSTHFGSADNEGVRRMEPIETGPVEHMVEIWTVESYFQRELGIDPHARLSARDWLTFQEHRLLTLTAGRVFHDDLTLEQIRERFAYYPRDVWLYLLASQWELISQEEPFMGRTGENKDEIGSYLIASRLVDRLMRLCYLMEKCYVPYSKWYGIRFQDLNCAPQLSPLLLSALKANDWREREKFLSQAFALAAHMHNTLGLTPPLPEEVSSFHGRPFQVIHGEKFAAALRSAIEDQEVRALEPYLGSVNQMMVESSDALQNVSVSRRACSLY